MLINNSTTALQAVLKMALRFKAFDELSAPTTDYAPEQYGILFIRDCGVIAVGDEPTYALQFAMRANKARLVRVTLMGQIAFELAKQYKIRTNYGAQLNHHIHINKALADYVRAQDMSLENTPQALVDYAQSQAVSLDNIPQACWTSADRYALISETFWNRIDEMLDHKEASNTNDIALDLTQLGKCIDAVKEFISPCPAPTFGRGSCKIIPANVEINKYLVRVYGGIDHIDTSVSGMNSILCEAYLAAWMK